MGNKRIRGITVDPDEVKRRFTPLIADGRDGPISYTRFTRYVQGECAKRGITGPSLNVLKEIWKWRHVDEASLIRLRSVTGVDLQQTPEEDRVAACIRRLSSFGELAKGGFFGDARRTSQLQQDFDLMLEDLLLLLPHHLSFSLSDKKLLLRLTGHVTECLQMFKKHPSSKQLSDLLNSGMSLAGSLYFYDESEANAAYGRFHFNCLGPRWDRWCHPQEVMSNSEIEYWNRRLTEAEALFRRAGATKDGQEIQMIRIARFRDLVKSPNGGGREADRLAAEINEVFRSMDCLNRAYFLVLRSHRFARHDDTPAAIDQLLVAQTLYTSALGKGHHFVGECELRLAQLGYPVTSLIESVDTVRKSKVPNSSIVDMHLVDQIISRIRRKEKALREAFRTYKQL